MKDKVGYLEESFNAAGFRPFRGGQLLRPASGPWLALERASGPCIWYVTCKAWFKRRILHAPNQIQHLVDSMNTFG